MTAFDTFRTKTAAWVLLVAAVFAVWVNDYAYLSFALRAEVLPDWRLESFAPVAEYLAQPLADGDYVTFSKRSSAVRDRLRALWFEGRLDPVFDSLDQSGVSAACSDSGALSEGGPFPQYCEALSVSSASSSSDPEDCSVLKYERNRKDCRETNDTKFSTVSDVHCSKSDCVVDNAVFRASATGIAPCSDVPESVVAECRRMSGEFSKYRSNTGSYFDADLESAISWRTGDPILLAARHAVLDNPDSPSSACSGFAGTEASACENRVKELFSYVQTKGLRERLERISKALVGLSVRKTQPVSK